MGEDEGPFFTHPGRVIRLRRKERKRRLAGWYLIVFPAVFSVAILIQFIYTSTPMRYSGPLLFILVLYGVAAYLYLKHHKRPAAFLEMRADSVCLYEDDDRVCDIDFGPDVEVEVILQAITRSERFGNLYGYSFTKKDRVIQISPRRDWDLWDIQAMRDPLFEAVDGHGMGQGPQMQGYRKAMATGTEQ